MGAVAERTAFGKISPATELGLELDFDRDPSDSFAGSVVGRDRWAWTQRALSSVRSKVLARRQRGGIKGSASRGLVLHRTLKEQN